MAIIVVSRGCYHRGSEVAKKAAAELGYECISREVLLEASALFDIPELQLIQGLRWSGAGRWRPRAIARARLPVWWDWSGEASGRSCSM